MADKRSWWVYIPGGDEAGGVVEADTLETALADAVDFLDLGDLPDESVEICAYELGPLHPRAIQLVECKLCGMKTAAMTAHRHQQGWVGHRCCWDERLRTTE